MFSLPETKMIILVLTATGAFASVMAVVIPFLRKDKRASRQKEITARREELSRQQQEQLAQQSTRQRPQAGVQVMKRFLEHFNLSKLLKAPELRQKMMLAGWRQQSAVITFVFLRFAISMGAILLAFLFFWGDQKYNLPFYTEFIIAASAGLIGFMLPELIVKNAIIKRQQEMTLAFPDALDLLLICVQAGLSIEAAFSRVTEEVSATSAALSQELGLTSAELMFLGDRAQAYENLSNRTGLPAAKSLVTALSQADKYGTPVGVALKVLSDESRGERLSKAEQKGAALPAKLTVPMIIFFLPVLFLVIVGPAVLQMTAM